MGALGECYGALGTLLGHSWGKNKGKIGIPRASSIQAWLWGGFRVGLERVLGGFGEGLGRVWGRFWEDFGKVWDLFGRSSAFSALFLDFAGLRWPFLVFSCSWWPFLVFPSLFSPFLGFASLCWPLQGFNACYYCWGRAKRASKASERSSLVLSLGFPCLPMLSLAYSCFLLLSVASLLCMLSGTFF